MMRSSLHQPASLKKADEERRNEFVWVHQEKFYSIAFVATGNEKKAERRCRYGVRQYFYGPENHDPEKMDIPLWDWLSEFIVQACEEHHEQVQSSPIPTAPRTDPSADGSAQMDWETTIILGPQRVERNCWCNFRTNSEKSFFCATTSSYHITRSRIMW